MKNVKMTVEKDVLTIKVDLKKSFGPSKSGKTVIIGTSEGNVTVPGSSAIIGINVYKKGKE